MTMTMLEGRPSVDPQTVVYIEWRRNVDDNWRPLKHRSCRYLTLQQAQIEVRKMTYLLADDSVLQYRIRPKHQS